MQNNNKTVDIWRYTAYMAIESRSNVDWLNPFDERPLVSWSENVSFQFSSFVSLCTHLKAAATRALKL